MPSTDNIHLQICTRSSPKKLVNVLNSIRDTIRHYDRVYVWLCIDDDDEVTKQYLPNLSYPFALKPCVMPRQPSMGHMHNKLQQQHGAVTGMCLPFPDDYVFSTQYWDEIVREAYWVSPDHIGLFFPQDPTVPIGQVTLPWISCQWINATGRLFPAWFPYWFDDNWIDQVAQLVNRKMPLPINTTPIGGRGKTRRMRNLPFWQNFFNCTFSSRVADAHKLLSVMWKDEQEGKEYVWGQAAKLLPALIHTSGHSDNDLRATEQMYSSNWGEHLTQLPEQYIETERSAVFYLKQEAVVAYHAGKIVRALGLLDTCSKSYINYLEDGLYAKQFVELRNRHSGIPYIGVAASQYVLEDR